MQDVIEFIARSLVEEPDRVQVDAHRVGSTLYVDVTAAPGDVGRLIGRKGRTAQAIRAVAKAAAAREGLRIVVDID
ncbi:MAG TPA: KH domain-containing protein [Anaerolineae bacterium]|nr:KH domain-containing protein [Caldilineae bacterium]HID33229.1 KH domain-containing protein [Anaerolineae bacterium]